MKPIPHLRAGVCVSGCVAAALVLLMLFGVVSCSNPAAPTNCKDSCQSALTYCYSLQNNPGWNTYCRAKYDECVAGCH